MQATFKHHFLRLFSVESQEGSVLVTQVQTFKNRLTVMLMVSDKTQCCFCSVWFLKDYIPATFHYWKSYSICRFWGKTKGKPSFSESRLSCLSGISFWEARKWSKLCGVLSSVSEAALRLWRVNVWEDGRGHGEKHPRQTSFQLEMEKQRSHSFTWANTVPSAKEPEILQNSQHNWQEVVGEKRPSLCHRHHHSSPSATEGRGWPPLSWQEQRGPPWLMSFRKMDQAISPCSPHPHIFYIPQPWANFSKSYQKFKKIVLRMGIKDKSMAQEAN